ncbi:hypothetical protein PV371_26350 [Streptomyces sp. TX20-6-3]|nr:hypothetical protein [Streptomyces sp. TX20-6-3]MDX2563157.1 hypothetical protein [Streptomyces sp. TX20-6-3]
MPCPAVSRRTTSAVLEPQPVAGGQEERRRRLEGEGVVVLEGVHQGRP